jgi:hypothetical protein
MSNLNWLAVNASPLRATSEDKELERRLSLYQVFLKLYEHHSSLLDEILQLENLGQPSFTGVKPRYIEGVVEGSSAYVMCNLHQAETQTLRQAQCIWTIGRDRSCGIYISDRRLSRRHAAIQYIEHQGFYLVDFKSTNGSYLNGEPVHEAIKLQDGDQIRLGSMAFSFFIANTSRTLPTVPEELLIKLGKKKACNQAEIPTAPVEIKKPPAVKPEETSHFCRQQDFIEDKSGAPVWQELNADQQSDILDRFLSRQIPDNPR